MGCGCGGSKPSGGSQVNAPLRPDLSTPPAPRVWNGPKGSALIRRRAGRKTTPEK